MKPDWSTKSKRHQNCQSSCLGERYFLLRKETKKSKCVREREQAKKKSIRNQGILMVGAGINYTEVVLAKPTKINYSYITEILVNWEGVRTSLGCDCLFWRTWTEEKNYGDYSFRQVQTGARNQETKEEMSAVGATT